MKFDGQPNPNTAADFSAVGQVLGSALGRMLAPNNAFLAIGASTVIGAAGQRLAQVFSGARLADGTKIDLSNAFNDLHVSIAGAGASSIASFFVAELGTVLHVPGFSGQLFNATFGGFTGSVANQIATKMVATPGLTFEAAIGGLDFGAAAANAAYGVSALFGSFLGNELVPAQTHTGAVGGQLLGAVGSAIGITAAVANLLGNALNFLLPGVGSLIGTILGTLIGDAFDHVPHPAAVDLIDQAGYFYNRTHYQVSASDGGDYGIADPMAKAAIDIINRYLESVKGAALDHSKQAVIGYLTDPQPFYINGVPGHPVNGQFLKPDGAVLAAALDVLQHTEVIGGDLLLKRAHQNSTSNHQQVLPPPDPSTQGGDVGGTGVLTPQLASAAEQLAIMSGDLALAQDYENYLNNREAINALMAANPDSAFTAGWIATFARVNELGLNHTNASDFTGGLVGYLDSVSKAGLGAVAANAAVSHGGLEDKVITVAIKVANGAEVPGSLSAFADATTIASDTSGQTVQLQFGANLSAAGIARLGAGATGGDNNSDLWFGGDGGQTFTGTGHGDILVGGAGNDTIFGGGGWDFIDGGAGNDSLFGQDGNDILRGGSGGDFLVGGAGDDTYVFNRGDGGDVVLDDGGKDSLVLGPGIALADLSLSVSGNDLKVGVKDPAHPNTSLTDAITLRHWFDADGFGRVENFRFADGTALDLAAGQSALTPYESPTGAQLAGGGVPEDAANGYVVGQVTGVDPRPNETLHYLLLDAAGGRFAIDASTGVITVANGAAIDYETAHAYGITVRTVDRYNHAFDKDFTIAVTDVDETPTGAQLTGGGVPENSANGYVVGQVTGVDRFPNETLHYLLLADAGGRFAINYSTGTITVANGALLDYETGHSHVIKVRTADQYNNALDRDFTIAVTDVREHVVNDFNGDGISDILLRSDGGTLVLWEMSGGHAVGSHQIGDSPVPLNWNIASTGDFNGDGKSDILLRSDAGSLVAWEMNDSQVINTQMIGTGVPDNWKIAGTADFAGDNNADLLWRSDGGTVVTWQMNNGQTLATNDLGAVPANWHIAGTGDFNGDGKSDLLWRSDGGTIVTWDMNGGQTVATHTIDVLPDNWKIAGIGDFNGDGKSDILLRSDGGTLVGWDMNDGAVVKTNVIGSVPDSWKIAKLGDFNGDGKSDILWRSDAGSVAIWDMDDGHSTATHDLGVMASNWHIV